MKPTVFPVFTIALMALSIAGTAHAIVVRGDAPDDAVLADPAAYPEVISLLGGRAAGTLIHESWIITAAHVCDHISTKDADRQLTLDGKPNSIDLVIQHPSWESESVSDPDVTDICLLRLAQRVTHVTAAPLYRAPDEKDKVITLAGWGGTGDGRSEDLVDDNQFRVAENRVDEVTPRLRFRFDEPGASRALELEAVSGPGDSGGPAFIEHNGVRHLAGVSSFQEDITAPGVFGVTENYERVSQHAPWIDSVIAR